MVQKTVLIVLAVAVLAGAGVLSVQHYHKYKHKQAQQAVRTVPASDFEALKTTTTSELTALQAANAALTAECQKGVAAYAQVPQITKTKLGLQTPSCPTAAR